ncbi:MAG: hypothetical protein LBB58_04365 [Cellulomonadaceae bacterium]|jgi:hypothetical protein|nr:hypothetical protein [Cellulomonadaceae bacterium]
MSNNYDGEEIEIKDEQISFEDGQLVEQETEATFPVMSAVVEEEVPVALVDEVEVLPVVEEPVVEAVPQYRVEEQIITEPAPVAVEEIHRPVWPWALGALALAGAVTALAWPHPTTQVAEPVVTHSPVAVVSVAPKATAKPLPAKVTPKATPVTLPAKVDTIPVPTCQGGKLVVGAETVLRDKGTNDGTEVTTLDKGAEITITEAGKDGWFPVTSGEAHGYVPVTSVTCQVIVTG